MNTLIIESLLISPEYVCDINNSIIPNQKFFSNQKVLASNHKVFWYIILDILPLIRKSF